MKLDCEEFIIAMHLINIRRKGIPIPDSLPPSLLPGNVLWALPILPLIIFDRK